MCPRGSSIDSMVIPIILTGSGDVFRGVAEKQIPMQMIPGIDAKKVCETFAEIFLAWTKCLDSWEILNEGN